MRLFAIHLLLFLTVSTTAQDLGLYSPGNHGVATESIFAHAPEFETVEPPNEPVRHMAEWEQVEAVLLAWHKYSEALKQIAFHVAKVAKVIIVCPDEATMQAAQAALLEVGANMSNIELLIAPCDSAWIRDYGPNTVYGSTTGERLLVDWVYNRIDRPNDDELPNLLADHLDVPLFSTTMAPDRMAHTGGNFMSDGLGNGFSSKLILLDNLPENQFGAGPHDEAAIDSIMQEYMGIQRFVKFDILTYDLIHHLDMHMKLLDEETLLVGEFPPGIADGPQIEQNLSYLTSNFNSGFGSPYKVIRIPMPPHPDGYPPLGPYQSYTNAVFINSLILVPTYQNPLDSTALQVYKNHFTGFDVIGVDATQIVEDFGALHCITKEIGVADPLLISHQRLPNICDNDELDSYPVVAKISHETGIQSATLFYSTDTTQDYSPISMQLIEPTAGTWACEIPHQPDGTQIFYYLQATSFSSKTVNRPLPAPTAYYKFLVDDCASSSLEPDGFSFGKIFPNPTSSEVMLSLHVKSLQNAKIEVVDCFGRVAKHIFEGELALGKTEMIIPLQSLPTGVYSIVVRTTSGTFAKLIIKN